MWSYYISEWSTGERREKISFASLHPLLLRGWCPRASIPLCFFMAWLVAEQVPPNPMPQWRQGNPGMGIERRVAQVQSKGLSGRPTSMKHWNSHSNWSSTDWPSLSVRWLCSSWVMHNRLSIMIAQVNKLFALLSSLNDLQLLTPWYISFHSHCSFLSPLLLLST